MRKRAIIPILLILIILARTSGEQGAPTAIIFDPLSTRDDSSRISNILEDAGYNVLEYKNGESTISKFKQIPPDVNTIVFRVHSSVHNKKIWLYSGEKYSTEKHQVDQLVENVHRARASQNEQYVFAMSSGFFERYLPELEGAYVLVLGCDAASSDELAKVFIGKGASGYVSWDGPVSLQHTDKVFTAILERIIEGNPFEIAVEKMKSTFGPDPYFNSSLRYYKQ